MLVVTGASGLLGASVVLSALNRGYEVCGIYHRHPIRFPGAQAQELDLTDYAATRDLLTKLHPRAIIHCAAATNVDWCEEHLLESEKLNGAIPAFLAHLAQTIGSRFVYISTDAVFD